MSPTRPRCLFRHFIAGFLLALTLLLTQPTATHTAPAPHAHALPPAARRLKALIEARKPLHTTARQSANLECTSPRTRREIRDLSQAGRTDWANAILSLQDEPSEFAGFSEWDVLVLLHVIYREEAHGGAYFLPWHRLFLIRIENAVRKSRPDFTLPYWDWSIEAADAAMSPVWGPTFAGGATHGPAPIPTGPFAGLSVNHPEVHTVVRNFSAGTPGGIPTLWNSLQLSEVISGVADWGRFSDGIEAAHDLLHVYVGGDMINTAFAPNDPVFYLHHAFVDSLWSRRQALTGLSHEFSGTHDFIGGTTPVMSSFRFTAFGMSVEQALDLSCVTYAPKKPNVPPVSEDIPEDICDLPEFQETNELTPARCRRADRVLRRSAAAAE